MWAKVGVLAVWVYWRSKDSSVQRHYIYQALLCFWRTPLECVHVLFSVKSAYENIFKPCVYFAGNKINFSIFDILLECETNISDAMIWSCFRQIVI